MFIKKYGTVLVLLLLSSCSHIYANKRSLLLYQLKNRPVYARLYGAVLVMRERAINRDVLRAVAQNRHRAVSRLLGIFATNDDPTLRELADIRSQLPDQLSIGTYPILCNAVKCMSTEAKNGKFLRRASWKGHEAVVKLLIGFGADVNKQSTKGTTALTRASRRGHKAVAQILRDAGARE